MPIDPIPTFVRPGLHHAIRALLLSLVLTSIPVAARAVEEPSGEQIYRQTCVMCHGANGEGTPDEYPRPLAGDRTVTQLARLIAKTMPADDPGTCTGTDSEKVATYIHDTFYSKAAQIRNAPARVELSRLTVRQYRNAVTDLLGSFRAPSREDDRHGLKGEYYKSRRLRGGDRVFERVDPVVHFDFGEESPDPEQMEAEPFSIRWEGSVRAPETGEYEFIVRTEHAMRLWINDLERPLIDALVRSGNDTEHRESIFLLEGDSYALRLEFSKAKQGVDDSKKQKVKPLPVKASISLEWKLPLQAVEVIPEHALSPATAAELFVLKTPFPPDDRSIGYERGTAISKAWDQSTTEAAIEVAGYVAGHVRELSGVEKGSKDRTERLREFAKTFAGRAFRRPLSDALRRRYVDSQFDDSADPDIALTRVVLLVLKSPRFLFREVGGEAPDDYDVAARIAFGVWDSLPDQPLLDAAAAGRLNDKNEVTRQAERMLADRRARSKLREFFLQWLKIEHVPDVAKDPESFPGFDANVATDLRTSLDLFVDDVVWGRPSSDFRQLLLADDLYLNGRLAKFYGVEMPPDAAYRKVSTSIGERAGILTHPYLMAAFAYTSTTSPIHRGVFLARSVLGRSLRPPPEAASPLPATLHPSLTTRERVALQTRPASCITCHGMINPLGFPLENFDAIGRYRSEESGRAIDASGTYLTRDGETVTFTGARDLARFLADSGETHDAFVEQLFHFLVKQPIRAYGADVPEQLRRSFGSSGYNIRKLVVEIVSQSSMPARDRSSSESSDPPSTDQPHPLP